MTPQPIETVPLNVEVLAYSEYGQNWHQVKWNGIHWTMRWNSTFRQFFRDYTHWMPLPPSPRTREDAALDQEAYTELTRLRAVVEELKADRISNRRSA